MYINSCNRKRRLFSLSVLSVIGIFIFMSSISISNRMTRFSGTSGSLYNYRSSYKYNHVQLQEAAAVSRDQDDRQYRDRQLRPAQSAIASHDYKRQLARRNISASDQLVLQSIKEKKTDHDGRAADPEATTDARHLKQLVNDTNQISGRDDCRGRKVFMYDIPAEFNTEIQQHCANDVVPWLNFCRHFVNYGFGRSVIRLAQATGNSNSSVEEAAKAQDAKWADWYETDPYMLEVIFHSQMEQYECRTRNASEADAVFIPYYSGLDALRFLYGSNVTQRQSHGKALLQWLEEKPQRDTWRRRGGHDHFVVMGRTAWDFMRPLDAGQSAWGTSLAVLPAMQNVTALFLEQRGAWPGQERVVKEQAIPYPTAFHPRSAEALQRWQNHLRRMADQPRRFLFAFVGAPRSTGSDGGCRSCNMLTKFRQAALQQCLSSAGAAAVKLRRSNATSAVVNVTSAVEPAACTILDCSKIKCAHNPLPIAKALLQAEFCLQPPGDTATRRSTFDGLLSGCIPAFFRPDSAYTQYTWHLPEDQASYSVDLTSFSYEELVADPLLVQRQLAAIPRERVVRMRSLIVDEVIPRIVYARPGSGLGRDAFHVTVQAMLHQLKTPHLSF